MYELRERCFIALNLRDILGSRGYPRSGILLLLQHENLSNVEITTSMVFEVLMLSQKRGIRSTKAQSSTSSTPHQPYQSRPCQFDFLRNILNSAIRRGDSIRVLVECVGKF
jgi:hypothetical protein